MGKTSRKDMCVCGHDRGWHNSNGCCANDLEILDECECKVFELDVISEDSE